MIKTVDYHLIIIRINHIKIIFRVVISRDLPTNAASNSLSSSGEEEGVMRRRSGVLEEEGEETCTCKLEKVVEETCSGMAGGRAS